MEKINELKSKKSDLDILEQLRAQMATTRKSYISQLDELTEDYNAFLATGKVYEPAPGELSGKSNKEILEIFRKIGPRYENM